MGQQATITVFDGATTPVSHTLQPVGNLVDTSGVQIATWRENILGLPTSAQVYATLKQRTLKSGVVETRFRVVFPVMEAIAGQNTTGYTASPKVAYEDSSEEVTYSHPRSTAAGRNTCLQTLRNALNNVSTTVTPVAAGPVHDAAVNLFMPT